jgi:hypothetical protein
MHRVRSSILAVYYCLFLNRFDIKNGYLYVPMDAWGPATVQHGVLRIPLESK